MTFGLLVSSSANGGVTTTGSVFDSGSTYYAGYTANGSVTIDAGSVLNRTSGYLGYFGSTTTGTATVTGPGSAWNSSSELYVGYNGRGVLNVQDGGLVSAGKFYANLQDLHGNGTISATAGAVLDADLIFDATHGTVQSMPFGTGGTLNLNFTPGGVVGAGYKKTGTLQILDGVAFSSTTGYLGYWSGSAGSATVSGAGSTWTNGDLYVGNSGSGTLNVQNGGTISNGSSRIGHSSGSKGTATVSGVGSTLTTTTLQVGVSGNGTLNIQNGASVTSTFTGYVGLNSNSIGTVNVSGPGSSWTSPYLNVGLNGNGTVNILNGGQLTGGGALGANGPAKGTVTVSGAGSTWNTSSGLDVGNGGGSSGTLNVLDYGRVSSPLMYVGTGGTVRLHVRENDMLVLGNESKVGSLTHNGTIKLYADAFLEPGVYTPIAEYLDRGITASGSGSYDATGGAWDSSAMTFTVVAPTELAAGSSDNVSSGERLRIADTSSGQRIGVAFPAVGGGVTFAATPMTSNELSALAIVPGFTGQVVSGWDFTTNLASQETLLSFDIGSGWRDLNLWHLTGGSWSKFAPSWQTYDSAGIVSFPVTSFSGYAVTATAVPEPATVTLLALLSLKLVSRRRPWRE